MIEDDEEVRGFEDHRLLFTVFILFQAVAVEDNAANLEAVLEPEGEDEAQTEAAEEPEAVTSEPTDEAEAGEEEDGNKEKV